MRLTGTRLAMDVPRLHLYSLDLSYQVFPLLFFLFEGRLYAFCWLKDTRVGYGPGTLHEKSLNIIFRYRTACQHANKSQGWTSEHMQSTYNTTKSRFCASKIWKGAKSQSYLTTKCFVLLLVTFWSTLLLPPLVYSGYCSNLERSHMENTTHY
jgi:hypothetical protein